MIHDQDPSTGYVLVVKQASDKNHRQAESYGKQLDSPVVIADSPAQAIAAAQLDHPHLVILSGESIQQWSPQMAQRLRQSVQPSEVIIVAVTDSSELSWQIEPKETGVDGFFVAPISSSVLSALNESAIAKYKCCWQYA